MFIKIYKKYTFMNYICTMEEIIKTTNNQHVALNNTLFIDRVFCTLKECGLNINYGGYVSKCFGSGHISVLKSLDLYKTVGRGTSKKTFVHPIINYIISTTISDSETQAKAIIDLCSGKFYKLFNVKIESYQKYNNLKESELFSRLEGCATYVIFNPTSKLYKIGRTKNIYKRLITLKGEYGKDIFLCLYNVFDFESKLHFEYRDKRIFGEWFSLCEDDLLDIVIKYQFKDNHTFSITL